MEKVKKKFIDFYNEAKNKPSPAQSFVTEIASVTKKSEISVRRWLHGQCEPDELTKSVLSKYLKCPAQDFTREKTVC